MVSESIPWELWKGKLQEQRYKSNTGETHGQDEKKLIRLHSGSGSFCFYVVQSHDVLHSAINCEALHLENNGTNLVLGSFFIGIDRRQTVVGRPAVQPLIAQTKTTTTANPVPTFSNSLVRAIFGRRKLISSRKRQSRPLQGHANFICQGVETLWKESSLCDVTLRIDYYVVHAHKLILCTFSDYFYDVILGDPKPTYGNDHSTFSRWTTSGSDRPLKIRTEILLNELDPRAVQSIVESLYTGKIYITASSVRNQLRASTFLKIKIITNECEAYLSETISKENCADLLALSTAYQLKRLEELSLKMMAKHFIEISASEQFLKLNKENIVKIMSRDDLIVTSEVEVLRAAMSWIAANEAKAETLEKIFQTIRLPLLSPQEIIDNVETVEYLRGNSRWQFLIKEALHYHCLPARQSILQSVRTVPRGCRSYTAVLAIGGAPRMVHDDVSRNIHYYDPKMKEWTLLTRLPQPRHHHAVAILGGFLYVAGGERNNDQQSPTDKVYRFDPRTDSWLQIASMNSCRESFQLVVLMDMIYAIGGRLNQIDSLATVERYSPAVNQWQLVARLSSPRRSMAAACHNGRIYVMGGSGERRISSKVERYNPFLNCWEQRRPLPCPRFFAQLAATKSTMYLVGGATVDQTGSVVGLPYVEAYDPMADSWTRLRQILEPRAEFGLALYSNCLYILGGFSWDRQERLKSVETYHLNENTSTYLPCIETPYTGISACVLTLYRRMDGKPMYLKHDQPFLQKSFDVEECNCRKADKSLLKYSKREMSLYKSYSDKS